MIANVAVFELPPVDAEIVAVVFDDTAVVFTENVAAVFPAKTVTVTGTMAEVELLTRVTTSPPVGAAPVRVIVAVDVLPPTTVAGLNVNDATDGGFTVSVADSLVPFRVAVIVVVV